MTFASTVKHSPACACCRAFLLGNKYFTDDAHLRNHQVSSPSAPIRKGEDRMSMDGRLSVLVRRDAADKRDDLRLFIDFGLLRTLINRIGPPQGRLVNGAESRKMAVLNVVLLGKFQQPGHDFVAFDHIDA